MKTSAVDLNCIVRIYKKRCHAFTFRVCLPPPPLNVLLTYSFDKVKRNAETASHFNKHMIAGSTRRMEVDWCTSMLVLRISRAPELLECECEMCLSSFRSV